VTLPRLLLVALVLTALSAVTAAVVQVVDRTPGGRQASAASPDPGSSRVDALGLDVLRAWDERRAEAWSRADPAALGALYAAGSVAGRRDVAMLRAWTARGLRVRGMRMQVLALDVVLRHPRRLVLGVTDRLARAHAVGPGVRYDLPRDAPSSHTVELVRVAGRWRVAAVRAAPHPVPQSAPQPPLQPAR
jgi:hypothetical protein